MIKFVLSTFSIHENSHFSGFLFFLFSSQKRHSTGQAGRSSANLIAARDKEFIHCTLFEKCFSQSSFFIFEKLEQFLTILLYCLQT